MVPVPKKPSITCLNDYRPAAPTKLVKSHMQWGKSLPQLARHLPHTVPQERTEKHKGLQPLRHCCCVANGTRASVHRLPDSLAVSFRLLNSFQLTIIHLNVSYGHFNLLYKRNHFTSIMLIMLLTYVKCTNLFMTSKFKKCSKMCTVDVDIRKPTFFPQKLPNLLSVHRANV